MTTSATGHSQEDRIETADLATILAEPVPTTPESVHKKTRHWKTTPALVMSALALILSGVAVANAQPGEVGSRGPQGAQGVQGAQGAQGDVGPAGPAGPKGDTGPRGLAGMKATSSGGDAVSSGTKEQACRDTFKDSLTQAQIDTYCVPGGMLY